MPVMGAPAPVRKAVFPAAGLGTRFLPATKAQPKEMLVLVDKPVIQYGVEEAVQSGVSNIIIVTGRGKNAIEDHFDVNIELESFLDQRGKKDQLAEVRKHIPGTRPEMLITLLTYCYSVGMYDSRDIEWASRTDRTIRYICAGVRPEWRTLRRFRRNHRDIIRASLIHVMKQTWAFHFETGEADYVGYEWFESELIHEFTETAVARLDIAALLDRADTD